MIVENLNHILETLPSEVNLVAVSKFHPSDSILECYNAGQRIFGESRPQELMAKAESLPLDIKWHFIGHLQTNKLKMVLPYADLVHSVDSLHLLQEIDKWVGKNMSGRKVRVLLELHLGAEQTKQGFHEEEILELMFSSEHFRNVEICGLMGMATHTDDMECVRADFERIQDFYFYLKDLFPEMESFRELSIGMSDDYPVAIECGATLVRIGSAIFGPRV